MLISHLTGAAKTAFMHAHGADPVETWSASDAELAIASVVPEHEAHFLKEGMAMHFRAETLADDIARFELLMKHGETDSSSRFLFDALRS